MARNEICKKVYLTPEGESRSASEQTTGLEFRFQNGVTKPVNPGNLPDSIRVSAMFHGLSQKLGDSYAGAKSVAEAIEAFEETLETLTEGTWVTAREGGAPRISQLALAYARAMAAAGTPIAEDEEKSVASAQETIRSWDDDKRKAAAEVPEIAVELAKIRVEAAQARLAAAQEKAKSAGTSAVGGGLAAL